MPHLTITPVQWSRLRDLHEVEPLGDADLDCLHELRAVLARHGMLARFALHLVHRHFDLAPDEVLVEVSDARRREQRLRVERRDDPAAAAAVPTTWMLDAVEPTVVCVCAARDDDGHLGRHASV